MLVRRLPCSRHPVNYGTPILDTPSTQKLDLKNRNNIFDSPIMKEHGFERFFPWKQILNKATLRCTAATWWELQQRFCQGVHVLCLNYIYPRIPGGKNQTASSTVVYNSSAANKILACFLLEGQESPAAAAEERRNVWSYVLVFVSAGVPQLPQITASGLPSRYEYIEW